jgi:hypothetical protein
MWQRRSAVLGASVVVCAAVVLAATAFAGTAKSPRWLARQSHGVTAMLAKHFAIFSRGHLAAAGAAQDPISGRLVQALGLDMGTVQFVQADGASVWVAQGTSGVCVTTTYAPGTHAGVAGIQFSSCGNAAHVAQAGLTNAAEWFGTGGQSGVAVASLVPNGNTAVGATDASGLHTQAVDDNVAFGAYPGRSVTVTYKNSSGQAASSVNSFPSVADFEQTLQGANQTGQTARVARHGR